MNKFEKMQKLDEINSSHQMQTDKQRKSSLIAMQKYEIFAPHYNYELASINKLRKKKK